MIDLEFELLNKIKNKSILIGVSGGVDSIVLLDLLNKNKDRYNFQLEIGHFNHITREGQSDSDAEFVRNLADKYGLIYHSQAISMYDFATDQGISPEEAGRILRKKFFESVISNKKNQQEWLLALAHNLDDQVETILMRIIRGTSLDGLEGMSEYDGKIIRPLLNTSKQDIIQYCEENNLEFRQDLTNFENIYRRNSIRNELIPLIKEKYNPSFDRAILTLANFARKQNEEIKDNILKELDRIIKKRGKDYSEFDKLELASLDDFILVSILREEIDRIASNYNFTQSHYDEILKIVRSDKGVDQEIFGLIFYNSFDTFIMRKAILPDQEIETDYSNKTINFNGYDLVFTGAFGTIKSTDNISIRSRKNGDRIKLFNREKKLKDFLIDKKIDKYDRDLLPIIVINDEIIAVADIYFADESYNKQIKIINRRKNE